MVIIELGTFDCKYEFAISQQQLFTIQATLINEG